MTSQTLRTGFWDLEKYHEWEKSCVIGGQMKGVSIETWLLWTQVWNFYAANKCPCEVLAERATQVCGDRRFKVEAILAKEQSFTEFQ